MVRARAVLAALLIMMAATPAWAQDQIGQISDLNLSVGSAEFLFSAANLPTGAQLDRTSVRVTVNRTLVRATAQPPGAAAASGGTSPQAGRAVMIVMDTSGSMGTSDLQQARQGVLGFLQHLPADVAAGITTTESVTAKRLTVPPSQDRQALSAALRAVRSNGATALYDAMATALAQLRRIGGGEHRMVVLTDGKDTSSHLSLNGIGSRLGQDRVPADIVAFKTAATSNSTLQALARASGGQVLPSPDAKRMIASFAGAAGSFSQAMWVSATLPANLAGKQVVLTVRARAGTVAVQAQTRLRLAGTVSAGTVLTGGHLAPAAAPAPAASGSLELIVVLVLCFAAIAAAVVAVSVLTGRPGTPTLADEIARYSSAAEQTGGDPHASVLLKGMLGLSRQVVQSGSFEERMARDLDRAGLTLRPHEWLLIRCGACLGLIVVLWILTGNVLIGIPLGVVLGWFATRAYLSARVTRRLNSFADQLPDALQLIASSLRSGFSVSQSLDRLSQQDIQPLGGEMSRAVTQTRLGVGIEDALDTVAERMDCRDLSWVVMAIRIQREVGGNLADVIETTVETMRERTHLRRHVRALSAEGRLSAYLLIAMPIFVVGALSVLRPDYLKPLFSTPAGVVLLVAGTVFMVVGWLWMSSIVKVEA